jgi:hypothetical protein
VFSMTSAAITLTVTVIAGGEEVGAPGRIRTFAPASGGRCSIP